MQYITKQTQQIKVLCLFLYGDGKGQTQICSYTQIQLRILNFLLWGLDEKAATL